MSSLSSSAHAAAQEWLRDGGLESRRGRFVIEAPSPDEIQPLVERGLQLARAPDRHALGYFLMADVYTLGAMP
jgi:hypothetical protein